MIVAGIMSGTSADGVDVAFARIVSGKETPWIKVLGHRSFPYTKQVRAAVLAAMNAPAISVADLSRLNWRLGALYAEAVSKSAQSLNLKPALVGLHGQTLYHQATAGKFLGAPIRATWQIGEPAVLAERLRIPIVSDFRPADLAAGGQGAPLVPMLDYTLFRHKSRNRLLLNLGGIANLTAIPAAGKLQDVLAFDTGPANMVVDALMQHHFAKPYDKSGKLAARGKSLPSVLAELLRDPYFTAAPPKSCGREQFGATYVQRLGTLTTDADPTDTIATATELTAASILDAYARFCWPHLGQRAPLARATDLIVAGGGTNNATLMRSIRRGFEPLGVKVLLAGELGLHAQAKEAVAFALLAWLSFHGQPGNVPSATGAARPVVLGKITQ